MIDDQSDEDAECPMGVPPSVETKSPEPQFLVAHMSFPDLRKGPSGFPHSTVCLCN